MSDFPTLAPAVEKPFTNAPRQESPFSAHLPQVVDAKSFQEEVRRYPDLVFETVVQIIDELEAARAENEALKQENEGLNEDISGLKENWMDVRDQTLGHHKQLISTQVALAKTHKALEDAQKGLRDAKEEHNQRRLDWNSRAQAYEELWAIDKAKQVILWKFIERLQKGSLSEGESDSMAALPPWTGTTKNPTRMFVTPDSVKPQVSSSTGTEYSRSPEKTFNPTAVSARTNRIFGFVNNGTVRVCARSQSNQECYFDDEQS